MNSTALHAWIKDRRLSHQEAADLLAESIHTLRKQLYGKIIIGRQTERIIELLDRIDNDLWVSQTDVPRP